MSAPYDPFHGHSQATVSYADGASIRPNWGWMVVAIVCFWPLAIASGISASRVEPALSSGNVQLARVESERAKRYGVIALIVGLVLLVLAIIAVGAVVAVGVHQVHDIYHVCDQPGPEC